MQGEWLRKPKGEASVVFVHGILSSGESCWKHERGTYWPELLQNEEGLDALGIYVYTYQTELFGGNYRLGDVVDDLKEGMKLDGLLNCKYIIFVCHSMGGIVVRQFLVERQSELIDKNIRIGLFLVGSPSLGSSYANWLAPIAWMARNAQALALRFSQNNAWLNDLAKNFRNLKEEGRLRIVGKELIEDKPIKLPIVFRIFLRRQIVEPFSAATFFVDSYKVPGSDHFSIAKPVNNGARQHRLLCQFITNKMIGRSETKPLETTLEGKEDREPERLSISDSAQQPESKEPGTIFRDKLKEGSIAIDNRKPRTIFCDTLKDGSRGPDMIVIPEGTFQMGDIHGCNTGRGLAAQFEKPVHEVRIRKPFAMGRYPVTFEEYETFAKLAARELPKDYGWGKERRPVIDVSWHDAVEYAKWLSEQTGKRYRLPTEGEWEYAARSGGDEIWAGTSNEQELRDYAVFRKRKTEPVGSRKPNGFGLYDMSGNVSEWVEDCRHISYEGAPKDGSAWLEAGGGICDQRVLRGGHYYDTSDLVRASYRCTTMASYSMGGFRLARDLE